MGILNVTDDSFYDGGRYVTKEAVMDRAAQILSEGGDIIDIGAMSTRPNALEIPEDEEISRIVSAVNVVRKHFPEAVLSIDTYRATVAEAAVEAGADMINDISGGTFDPDMIPTVGRLQVPYCLMHTTARPSEMQQHTEYKDILADMLQFFGRQLEKLHAHHVHDIIIEALNNNRLFFDGYWMRYCIFIDYVNNTTEDIHHSGFSGDINVLFRVFC